MYKYLTEENKFEKISKNIDKDFIASIVPDGCDEGVVSFIQGSLKKVSEKDKTVIVTKPDLSELKLNFDALVLCTGVDYSFPWRDTLNEKGRPSSYAERII